MEEAIPTTVSDARGVNPEAIYDGGKKRGIESINKGESEYDQADRKKMRRIKKKARRKVRAQKEADERLVSRLSPGLSNPYEAKKIRAELQEARAKGGYVEGKLDQVGDYSKSGEYFKRLQEEGEGGGTMKSAIVYSKNGDGGKGKKGSQYKL